VPNKSTLHKRFDTQHNLKIRSAEIWHFGKKKKTNTQQSFDTGKNLALGKIADSAK
jgi:hypothetical protein